MKRASRIARAVGALGLIVGAGACVVGPPPGFSAGDSWTFPLVGPLENGQLITPVMIDGKGPYLFAIDPDSPLSSIDEGVASELKPHTYMGPRFDDEQDTTHPTKLADILRLKIGTLDVSARTVWIVPVGTFNNMGRQIRGVIGRDIITDSTVLGFDRDLGVGYIAITKGFKEPGNAAVFGYRTQTSHLGDSTTGDAPMTGGGSLPAGRHIASIKVNGVEELLHVDLGAVPSQLREDKWAEAKLQTVPSKEVLIDEIGRARQVDHAGLAQQVSVAGVTVPAVTFVPYDDRRWEREDIDGTVGLGFFKGFQVWADWNHEKVYLVPRADDLGATTKQRIDRWGSQQLSTCPHTACVDVQVIAGPATAAPMPSDATGAVAGAAPTSAPGMHVEKDAAGKDLNLEVVIEAVGADGKPMHVPRMVANLPVGVDSGNFLLDASYAGASLRVVDASPFVRACQGAGACLYQLNEAQ